MAYEKGQDLASSTAKTAGFSEIRFFDFSKDIVKPTGLQAILLTKPGLRVLAFRGSDDQLDWVANADELTRSGSTMGLQGNLHSGFSSQFESGWEEISKELKKANATQPLLITGHSLGGALSAMFGMRLALEGYPVARVVTFAAPRPGDAQFAQSIQTTLGRKFIRVARTDDFITMYPPSPATADVSAQIATLGQPQAVAEAKALQFKGSNYKQPGNAWILNPGNGELVHNKNYTDGLDTGFLKGILDRKLATNGDLLKLKAIDDELWAAHFPSAYFCAIYERN